MCEMAIRIRMPAASAILNVGVLVMQSGDVVDVRENKWPWQKNDLSFPDWRMLRVPDMSVAEASLLLMQEGKGLRRAQNLDVRATWLPKEFLAWIEDDSRSRPIYTLFAAEVRRMVITKNPSDHFTVIG